MNNLDQEMPGIAWDLLPMAPLPGHNWHCLGNLDGRQPGPQPVRVHLHFAGLSLQVHLLLHPGPLQER